MAVKIGQQVRVALDIDGEDVVATFPPRTDSRMVHGVRKMKMAALGSGRGTNMRKIGQKLDQARVEFFDTLCLGVENVIIERDGADVPLTTDIEDWAHYVPEEWKTSFARYFDEREVLSANDLGN